METIANIKLTLDEIDFILKIMNDVPIKGFTAQSFLLKIANKLQTALNESQKPLVNISPEQIKQAEEIMRHVKEKEKPNPEIKRK